jgi:putative hemolysin
MLAVELLVLIILILLNGLLAFSELAVVSSRRSRLKTLVEQGKNGSRRALALASDPGRFLSTVQIGITLVGVLAGAFSGATLGLRLADLLTAVGVPPGRAEPVGVVAVVVLVTYLSIIIGELVPKQLALRDPERFARLVAPAMTVVARIAAPAVTLLDASGRFLLWLLRVPTRPEAAITDEEIHVLIAEAERAGVIEPVEHSMIAGVMRLGDRSVRAVMTPRREVYMIDLEADPDEIRRRLRHAVHSRVPVYRGDGDKVIGIIQAKDLLDAYLSREMVDPRDFVRPAPIVPDTIDALDAIEVLKNSDVHLALVHDEYGDFEGIVTSADILEAIAGAFRTTAEAPPAKASRRADGGWLLDGDFAADEMADLLGLDLPEDAEYHTVAGFILDELGRLPAIGEDVVVQDWRFEVVDLDGRRIDKVLAERVPARRGRRGAKPKKARSAR